MVKDEEKIRRKKKRSNIMAAVAFVVMIACMTVNFASLSMKENTTIKIPFNSIAIKDIESIELGEGLSLKSRFGISNSKCLVGKFTLEEGGSAFLSINRSSDKNITIVTKEKKYIVNMKTDSETKEFYNNLKKLINK